MCSGIEAASVAWPGWEAVGFSEIEKFPSAVLAHHYPSVPNLGDMTRYREWEIGAVDLLVGGTPCQSFSVAGLRKGLEDPRGNLMLVYCGILDWFKPRWFVWENVPGVLSSNGGRDFGAFLGAVAELGYGWAYRVLDAQYFGVAQRRRRVFVVGCLGDWESAAQVLFEPESLSGNPAPRREAGQTPAPTIAGCANSGGSWWNGDQVTPALTQTLHNQNARGGHGGADNIGAIVQPYEVGNCLTQRMHKGINSTLDEGQTPVLAIGTDCYNGQITGDVAATMGTPGSSVNASGPTVMQPVAPSLTASNDPSRSPQSAEVTQQVNAVYASSMQVRRLTPVECERLQGFPDGYTNIPWRGKPESPDGPRYKALGNCMAVPVMRWIGQRIDSRR